MLVPVYQSKCGTLKKSGIFIYLYHPVTVLLTYNLCHTVVFWITAPCNAAYGITKVVVSTFPENIDNLLRDSMVSFNKEHHKQNVSSCSHKEK
jgi:hypothetical protein